MSETYAPSGEVGSSLSRFTSGEATGTFGSMDRTNMTRIADRIRYLADTGGLVSAATAYIGDSANGDVTLGLTINQGAADDQILALKSSDVAHGITTAAETDTYFAAKKYDATNGGAQLLGYNGSSGAGLYIFGTNATADATRSTSGIAPTVIGSSLKSGTTDASNGADKNIAVIRNFTDTKFIFDSDGDFHADSSSTTF